MGWGDRNGGAKGKGESSQSFSMTRPSSPHPAHGSLFCLDGSLLILQSRVKYLK